MPYFIVQRLWYVLHNLNENLLFHLSIIFILMIYSELQIFLQLVFLVIRNTRKRLIKFEIERVLYKKYILLKVWLLLVQRKNYDVTDLRAPDKC